MNYEDSESSERDWADRERAWITTAIKNHDPRVTIALASSYPIISFELDKELGTIHSVYLANPDFRRDKN